MNDDHVNCASRLWKHRSKLEKKLIVGSWLLFVIATLFMILYVLKSKYIVIQEEVCTSEFCLKAATDLLQFIDFTQDPCENFYEYVCGTYNNTKQINYSTPTNTVIDDTENDLKAITTDPIEETDGRAHILIKKFYRECINETKIEGDQNAAFKKAVSDLGGWPLLEGANWNASSFNWIEWYIKSKKLGLPIFGFFLLKSSESEANTYVLKIEGPAGKRVNIEAVNYNTAMRKIIQILGGTSFNETENMDVVKFSKDLRSLVFHTEINEAVYTMKELVGNCTFFDWMNLLNSMAGEDIIENSSHVAFGEIGSYCVSLEKLINSTQPRTMANYFVWSIINQMILFMSSDIREAYAPMSKTQQTRNEACVSQVNLRFPNVAKGIYIRKRRPPIVKEQINDMMDKIEKVFVEHIKTCSWMDDSTKVTAINRTQSITGIIGGDELFDDDEAFEKMIGIDGFNFTSENIFEMALDKRKKDIKNFFRTLSDEKVGRWPKFIKVSMGISAVFNSYYNFLVLPAAILGSMFYDYRAPAFFNYASIGSIIGHEIMHGLEKSGRLIVQNNTLVDWWTNATADAYDEAVKCIIDDYDNGPFKHVENGKKFLDENLSDLVGVDVSYEGYMKHVMQHGTEKKLPLNITTQQVFWVRTGNYLCIRGLDRQTIYESHGPSKYRIMAPARHSRYFAKDFQCSENSYMNPKHKCRIL